MRGTRRFPPGPANGPLGVRHIFALRYWPLKLLSGMGWRYGDISSIRIGTVRIYLVNHPELIRQVVTGTGKKFRKSELQMWWVRRTLGEGILTSDGEVWRKQRRIIQPFFNPNYIRHHVEDVVGYAEQMAARWSPSADVEILEEMTQLTLVIAGKTIFGSEISEAAEIGEAVRVASELTAKETYWPVQIPDWLPLPHKIRRRRAVRFVSQKLDAIIRQRQQRADEGNDLLWQLLKTVNEQGSAGMTAQQVRDEVITLFNAAFHTTSVALAWMCYLLAKHPRIAARVAEEIDSTLGSRQPTFDDLPRLSFCQMVVKETLRYIPPAWGLFVREATEDLQLGDYHLRKGSPVMVIPFVTQRDPRFFPDPLRFDPDRFSPGREEKIPPYAYLPFGGGGHVCIGNHFATMQMTLVMATVLRHFRLELAAGQADPVLQVRMSLLPKDGIRLSVRPRQSTLAPTVVGASSVAALPLQNR